jgi:hypothetical protein
LCYCGPTPGGFSRLSALKSCSAMKCSKWSAIMDIILINREDYEKKSQRG